MPNNFVTKVVTQKIGDEKGTCLISEACHIRDEAEFVEVGGSHKLEAYRMLGRGSK